MSLWRRMRARLFEFLDDLVCFQLLNIRCSSHEKKHKYALSEQASCCSSLLTCLLPPASDEYIPPLFVNASQRGQLISFSMFVPRNKHGWILQSSSTSRLEPNARSAVASGGPYQLELSLRIRHAASADQLRADRSFTVGWCAGDACMGV